MRTVFFGTPDFAVPSLDATAAHTEVCAVVCQPDKPAGRGMKLRPPPVKRRALELGLPVLQPRRLKAPSFRQAFAELAPELCLVAAYGKILPNWMLEAVPRGFVNVHASLLPRLRGAAPIHRCVLGAEARTGVAIMKITEGLDEGPVYLDEALELTPEYTAGRVHDELAATGARLLGEYLQRVVAGEALEPTEQDHAGATHAPKLDPAEFEVRWEQPATRVDHTIRGLSPWPGAYSFLEGKRLKLLFSVRVEGQGEPGTLLRLEDAGPVVACGEGAVRLERVQPAGKRAMDASDWARGARLEPGLRLGPAS